MKRGHADSASEKRTAFHQQLIAGDEPVFVVRPYGGAIIDANQPARHAVGCSREELIGRHLSEFVGQDLWSTVRTELAAATSVRGCNNDVGGTLRTAHGTSIPVLVHVELYRAAMHRYGIVTFRRTEAAVASNDISDLFENSLLGMFRITPAGELLLANRTFARMNGCEALEELRELGTPLPLQRMCGRFSREEHTTGLETAWRTPDGQMLFVRVSCKTVRDEKGTVRYYEGSVEDITKQKNPSQGPACRDEIFPPSDMLFDWEYWMDAGGNVVSMSPSCVRITGYEAEDFLDDRELLEQIVHPADRDFARLHGQAGPDRERCHSSTFRIITQEGDERWIEHVCQPVFREDGTYAGRRAANRDITAKVQSHRNSVAAQHGLRRMLDASPDMALLLRRDGTVLELADRAGELLGTPAQIVRGQNIRDIGLSERFTERLLQQVEAATDTGRMSTMEFHAQVNEEPRDFEARIRQVDDERAVVVIRDVSVARAADDELRTYRDRLEEKLKERTAQTVDLTRQLAQEAAERRKAERKLSETSCLVEAIERQLGVGLTLHRENGEVSYVGGELRTLLGDSEGIEERIVESLGHTTTAKEPHVDQPATGVTLTDREGHHSQWNVAWFPVEIERGEHVVAGLWNRR